ncbi:hypothetical protein J4G63_19180 [Aeromonas sobria]|uniref:hypothetical protein n=1 Tax=Aeromonas sobria TaxID=646 RepID=UPI001676D77F|nr:hypothetical protein [Aeromonas sobria]MBS4689355.1 hypothetical protein [Aeromonas sobria]
MHVLLVFAKIAIARDLSGIHVFMAWGLMIIAFYGAIASICLFMRKVHVYYGFLFSSAKDGYPELILSAVMKVIEISALQFICCPFLFYCHMYHFGEQRC